MRQNPESKWRANGFWCYHCPRNMMLGIDASRMDHESATGVEMYSAKLIPELLRIATEKGDQCILYSQKTIPKFHQQARVIPFPRLWTQFRLSLEMLRRAPDVLFIPSHTLPIIHPKKSVVTIHDVAFKRLKKAYSWQSYQYLDWSTRFAVRFAARIITPSEATKNDLREFYRCPAEKISVIYHGFDPPKISSSLSAAEKHFACFDITPKTPFFLFVGRLEIKKNLVRLLRAFSRFSEKYPDFRLVLAGKRGIGFEQILQEARDLNLLEKVIMPGYVTEEEKAWLYSNCCAVVFVSLEEGFGLPLLEAFHFQKPILASDIPVLHEIAGSAALFVDPKDIKAIENGLFSIAHDAQQRNDLVLRGREQIQHFSWNTCAEQTYRVITE